MSDRQSGEVLDHFSGHTPTPVLAVAVATSLCSAGFLEEFFSETGFRCGVFSEVHIQELA
jgi:hypothetical protein